MDQDHARRSAPGTFFIFVSPTALVRQPAAAEEIGLFPGARRIVNQHYQELVLVIRGLTLVVIPALFRSVDAVADKYQISVYANVVCLRPGEGHIVIGKFEGFFAFVGRDIQLRVWIGLHADQRNLLKVTAVRTRALQTHRFELRREVLSRNLATASAGA